MKTYARLFIRRPLQFDPPHCCVTINRLREAIKGLEENEEDLVSEIEILSNERHTLELKQIDQCKINEKIQNTIDEKLDFCASLKAEKVLLKNAVEVERKTANQWQL